jgi:iron complex outermembrane receptor protein
MIRKLLLGSIAAITTMPALAQSGQQSIEEILVTSNSRRAQGLGDINAAVAVIGQQELDLIDLTHYQEALSRLPGYSGHRNNGQESLNAIRSPVLTGAGACGAFLIAENNIPVRSSGFCNINEMFDTHTENAASIELVRGPASAFYGSNAVHGMINVVLPEPGDAGEISLEAGPRGSSRIRGKYGRDYGNFKQLLLFSGVNEEGYRDDSGVDGQKVSWLYSYNAEGGTQLDGGFSIVNLNQETASYVIGLDAYKGNTRDGNPNPEAHRDSVNSRVWTTISRTVNDWDLVFTPYYREVNMNFVQHFLQWQPIEDNEHRSLGAQLAGYRGLSNGANLAIGFDIEETEGRLLEVQPNPTPGSFFLRNSIPQGKHYDYEVDASLLAAFINYEQSYDSGWNVSFGLRLENMDYSYDNQMIDGRTDEFGVPCRLGCRYNRPGDRDDSFTNISPKLGLSYALNDNSNLQIRVQRGFRAPQSTELYRLQNAQNVADLDSVELDSYEVSINSAGDNWNYSASVYFMDKDNEILTDSSRINLNGNHTKHRGIELAVGIDISDSLNFRGVFNLASHTYENSQLSGGIDIKDNDVDSAPNTFGNIGLQWRPSSAWVSELEMLHMGDYYTNPENTASYDGHEVFNLRTQYTYSESLRFSLNIMNLLDKEYAERADWTSFVADRYFPGEPARVFLAVNWKYR